MNVWGVMHTILSLRFKYLWLDNGAPISSVLIEYLVLPARSLMFFLGLYCFWMVLSSIFVFDVSFALECEKCLPL